MSTFLLGVAAVLGLGVSVLTIMLATLTTRLGCWIAGHEPVVLPVMLSRSRTLPVRCKRCRRLL